MKKLEKREVMITYCDRCEKELKGNHAIIAYPNGKELHFCSQYTSEIEETCLDKHKEDELKLYKMGNKCDDAEICSGNSDAECFAEEYPEAMELINKNPTLCDICVYNKKNKGHDYKSWKKYRKKIGIPPK